jgi:hypothetical protein
MFAPERKAPTVTSVVAGILLVGSEKTEIIGDMACGKELPSHRLAGRASQP